MSIASFIDITLYSLVAITIALIVYKTLDFYAPNLIGRPKASVRLGATEASLQVGLDKLESWLALLAVIASAAPFIGLAGTVLHIIVALKGLGASHADMTIISGPIATALNSTLVGLASAIPAVIAHALFQRKLQSLETVQRQLIGQKEEKAA